MSKREKILLILLFISCFFGIYRKYFSFDSRKDTVMYRKNILNFEETKKINIPINPMSELDFLSKEEVFNHRIKYVYQHRELIQNKYFPSDEVYGGITSAKSWWGVYGIAGYANGEKSIEGPSEETRFLNNPYILTGLCENFACFLEGFNPDNPVEIYPKPLKLVWYPSKRKAKVLYDYTSYVELGKQYHLSSEIYREMCLYCINARDLGFNYTFIETPERGGITSKTSFEKILRIPFYIHLGSSSGYSGGSNNGSPSDKNFDIYIKSVPAEINMRFWFEKPVNQDQEADFSFTITLI